MKPTVDEVAARPTIGFENAGRNDTEVYDAPITEVIAAAHRMTPKTRMPASPAAAWKAWAAGLAAVRVEHRAAGDHAEDGEEQQDPHHAGDQDAGDRAAGDLATWSRPGDAGVDQPVRAGVGDVAADGAADRAW